MSFWNHSLSSLPPTALVEGSFRRKNSSTTIRWQVKEEKTLNKKITFPISCYCISETVPTTKFYISGRHRNECVFYFPAARASTENNLFQFANLNQFLAKETFSVQSLFIIHALQPRTILLGTVLRQSRLLQRSIL